MSDSDIVQDFLVESYKNLERLSAPAKQAKVSRWWPMKSRNWQRRRRRPPRTSAAGLKQSRPIPRRRSRPLPSARSATRSMGSPIRLPPRWRSRAPLLTRWRANVGEAAHGSGEITSNIAGVAQAAASTSRGASATQKAVRELVQMFAELRRRVMNPQTSRQADRNWTETTRQWLPYASWW